MCGKVVRDELIGKEKGRFCRNREPRNIERVTLLGDKKVVKKKLLVLLVLGLFTPPTRVRIPTIRDSLVLPASSYS